MPKYKQSAITAKNGINFIRDVIESNGSLFLKIDQENDLGVDAIVEFMEGEDPLNKQVAMQIKSGDSYYNNNLNQCSFPIGGHRGYWEKYPLAVFGLVFVPELDNAYWVNIKQFLQNHPHDSTVSFTANETNKFNSTSFNKVFVPLIKKSVPNLGFDEAFEFAQSQVPDERHLGLFVLFRRYLNEKGVWEEIINFFKRHPADEIPSDIIYWLAHIPGHGDIWHSGEQQSTETRSHARSLLSEFEIKHVIKLLSFINPEQQISRGTLGQSVEAIISSLPNVTDKLHKIIESKDVEMHYRESVALILAMNEAEAAIPYLIALEKEGSWPAGDICRHVKEYGGINPYS